MKNKPPHKNSQRKALKIEKNHENTKLLKILIQT
jgi:hypothetical protein